MERLPPGEGNAMTNVIEADGCVATAQTKTKKSSDFRLKPFDLESRGGRISCADPVWGVTEELRPYAAL